MILSKSNHRVSNETISTLMVCRCSILPQIRCLFIHLIFFLVGDCSPWYCSDGGGDFVEACSRLGALGMEFRPILLCFFLVFIIDLPL